MSHKYSKLVEVAQERRESLKDENETMKIVESLPSDFGLFMEYLFGYVIGFQWFLDLSFNGKLPRAKLSLPSIPSQNPILKSEEALPHHFPIAELSEYIPASPYSHKFNYEINSINWWAIPFNYMARNFARVAAYAISFPVCALFYLPLKIRFSISQAIMNFKIHNLLKSCAPREVSADWFGYESQVLEESQRKFFNPPIKKSPSDLQAQASFLLKDYQNRYLFPTDRHAKLWDASAALADVACKMNFFQLDRHPVREDEVAKYVDTNNLVFGFIKSHQAELSEPLDLKKSFDYGKYRRERERFISNEFVWSLLKTVASGFLIVPLLFTIQSHINLIRRHESEEELMEHAPRILRSLSASVQADADLSKSDLYVKYPNLLEESLRTILSMRPLSAIKENNLNSLYNIGKLLLAGNRFDLAFQYFSKISESSRDYLPAMEECGHAFLVKGDHELSQEYFQKAEFRQGVNIAQKLAINPEASWSEISGFDSNRSSPSANQATLLLSGGVFSHGAPANESFMDKGKEEVVGFTEKERRNAYDIFEKRALKCQIRDDDEAQEQPVLSPAPSSPKFFRETPASQEIFSNIINNNNP